MVGLRELQLAGRRQRVQGGGLDRRRGQGERDQGPNSDHGVRRRPAALAVEAGGSLGHRNQHDPCASRFVLPVPFSILGFGHCLHHSSCLVHLNFSCMIMALNFSNH